MCLFEVDMSDQFTETNLITIAQDTRLLWNKTLTV
jgi:hypothetical protein